MDYPKPCGEPWHPSELEDYNHVKNDDERRRMLLIFGYDEAHRWDAERLFSPPPEPELVPPDPAERIEAELREQTKAMKEQMEHERSEFDTYRKSQEIQHLKDKRDQWIISIVTGICSSVVGGLIVYAVDHWPEIVEFFSSLVS